MEKYLYSTCIAMCHLYLMVERAHMRHMELTYSE